MIHMTYTQEEGGFPRICRARHGYVQLKSRAGTSESERERRERPIVANSLIFLTVHGVRVRFRSFTLVDFAGEASRPGLIQE